MNNQASWNTSCSHHISASAADIWAVWLDTSRWPEWNEGVIRIDLQGDFSKGQKFAMHLPEGDIIHSELVDVQPLRVFIDESWLGETVIRVEHRIEALPQGGCRVTYATHVQGPDADHIGPAVSGDFPAVLERLAGYSVERAGALASTKDALSLSGAQS